jgi:2-haloacid dehalogenase/putative hydrolase of the HAD superfamily
LWLNRFGKAVPEGVTDIKDLLGTLDIIGEKV